MMLLIPRGWAAVLLLALLLPGSAVAAPDYFSGTITREALCRSLIEAGVPASRLPLLGASHYVLVRRSEVSSLIKLAHYRLSRDLGPRWDQRFNCLSFAWNLVNEATKELAREDWHAPVPAAKRDSVIAIRPAVVAISYLQNGGQSAHAINLIATDEGLVWYDPQNGREVRPPRDLETVFYPDS